MFICYWCLVKSHLMTRVQRIEEEIEIETAFLVKISNDKTIKRYSGKLEIAPEMNSG